MNRISELTDITDIRPQKSWVVFTNQTELPWLRFFKRGFRHCFVLLHDGECWISVDPMSNYIEVAVHNVPTDFDLSTWLRMRGHHIVEAELTQDIKRSMPLMLFTCVEACKRILGVHDYLILTPWQLYRHLNAQGRKIYNNSNQDGGLL